MPTERLRQDAETLVKSMRRGWVDLTVSGLSGDDRAAVKSHVRWCIAELAGLLEHIGKFDDADGGGAYPPDAARQSEATDVGREPTRAESDVSNLGRTLSIEAMRT